MIIVFTGNGKGKTTAALGQAARMVGRGKRVLMIQWIKGPWKSGEDFIEIKQKEAALPAEARGNDAKAGEFKLIKKGLGFVGILGDTLPRKEHERAAQDAFELAKKELAGGEWDLIICDELNVALSLNLLKLDDVLAWLATVPKEKFILSTGRGAPQALIDAADLATEMKEIKHPFNDGALAKIAVEF